MIGKKGKTVIIPSFSSEYSKIKPHQPPTWSYTLKPIYYDDPSFKDLQYKKRILIHTLRTMRSIVEYWFEDFDWREIRDDDGEAFASNVVRLKEMLEPSWEIIRDNDIVKVSEIWDHYYAIMNLSEKPESYIEQEDIEDFIDSHGHRYNNIDRLTERIENALIGHEVARY